MPVVIFKQNIAFLVVCQRDISSRGILDVFFGRRDSATLVCRLEVEQEALRIMFEAIPDRAVVDLEIRVDPLSLFCPARLQRLDLTQFAFHLVLD